MARAFERKTNRFLACAVQSLSLARSHPEHAQTLITAALLAFERSVEFYLLERIAPDAGNSFDPQKLRTLANLLAYYHHHQGRVGYSEIVDLYRDNASWLSQLAAIDAEAFNARDTAVQSSFFSSDNTQAADEPLQIAKANDSQSVRLTPLQLETWLNEFQSLVKRQRLENDEY